jgi:hypothetical protein
MHQNARLKLVRATAIILGVAAPALAVLGIFLIKDGAYPPEGTGSLGHVGMVIAGVIATFLGVVLGLFSALCISKIRAAAKKIAE